MRFRLLGIPVTVQPLFWLGAVLLGLMHFHNEARALVVWVPNVFFAVLVHEMGHALVGRRFGLDPEVHLLMLGGRTVWPAGRNLSPGRSILVSFAGPAIGLVLGGALQYSLPYLPDPASVEVVWFYDSFIWTNLGWAIFNLLPIVGMDGGNIMAALFDHFLGARGVRWAHLVSVFVAAGLGILCIAVFRQGGLVMAFFFGLMAIDNYQRWQIASHWNEGMRAQVRAVPARAPAEPERSIEPEIQRAYEALEAGNHTAVRRIAESLVPRIRTEAHRFDVAHLVAWGRLLTGDPQGAERALRQLMPLGKRPDALLEGALLLDVGQGEAALAPLTEALAGRDDDFVASRLARAAVLAKDVGPILRLLSKTPRVEIAERPLQIVVAALMQENVLDAAAALGEALFGRFGLGTDAFNVACAHARAARFDEASAWLDKALAAGLPDPKVLLVDDDLRGLRERPEFEPLRARVEGSATP